MAEGRWQMETSRKSQTVGLRVGKGSLLFGLDQAVLPLHTQGSGTVPIPRGPYSLLRVAQKDKERGRKC